MRSNLVLGLGVLALFLTGCGRRESSVDSGSRTQTLYVGNGVEPQELDPHLTTGSYESAIQAALFEPLLQRHHVTGKIQPAAAESWTVSPDGRTFDFRLRAGSRWSDGQQVTAHDFAESFRRLLTASVGAEYATDYYCITGARDFHVGKNGDFASVGVTAIDPLTLRYSLERPVPHFLDLMAGSAAMPIPSHVLTKFGGFERRGSGWTRPGNLVGNGPFVLKEWQPNKHVVVERNPTYWNQSAVRLRAIHFLPVEDADAEERMFRSRQLHITRTVPSSKVPGYQQDSSGVLRSMAMTRNYYYVLNLQRPALSDVRVRRALALAIDRRRIVEKVLRAGQKAGSHFAPEDPSYAVPEHFTHNAAEAQQLLAAAGFPGGAGFPRFQLLLSNSGVRAVAEAIQEMWRQTLGVHIEFRNEEWKVYLDTMKKGDFDITYDSWNIAHPFRYYELLSTGNSSSYNRWSNSTYDSLLGAAASTPIELERHENYRRMEELIAREIPVIPIYFDVSLHLVRPEVEGWHANRYDVHAWQPMALVPGR